MNTAIVLVGAAGAGALDGNLGEIAGQRPSVALGVLLLGAGFAMKSPKALYAAGGALAPIVYEATRGAVGS